MLVPEYEVREAAIFGHYNWNEWLELTAYDREMTVAHYRLHHLIESHISDAVAKKSQREQNGIT